MKVLVRLTRQTTGALPWHCEADVPAFDDTGKPITQRIRTCSCSTRWGALYEIRKELRRHIRRGKQRLVEHKVLTLKVLI